MKRSSHRRQTLPRITCLADYVYRLDDPCMPRETQRRLLKAHHGTWSAPMSVEEVLRLLGDAAQEANATRG